MKKDRLAYVVLLINFYDIDPYNVDSYDGSVVAAQSGYINVIKFFLSEDPSEEILKYYEIIRYAGFMTRDKIIKLVLDHITEITVGKKVI